MRLYRICISLPMLFSIAIFVYLANKYSLNIPLWDDDYQYLNFLNRYVSSDSVHDKIMLLLKQHNEHRIALPRLILLGYYQLFSCLNFRNLLFISQFILALSIFPATFIFNKIDNRSPLLNFALATVLVLCPSQCGSFIWLGSALQQNLQILLSLLTIFYLIDYLEMKSNRPLFLAMGLILLNVFVGGGWINMGLAVIVFSLFIKDKKLAIISILIFLLMAWINFKLLPYTIIPRPRPTIIEFVVFVVGFIGITFFTNKISFLAGIIMMAYEFKIIKQIFSNRILLLWTMFFGSNLLLIAFFRAGMGSHGIVDRYAIYSLINLGILTSYFWVKENNLNRRILIVYIFAIINGAAFLKQIYRVYTPQELTYRNTQIVDTEDEGSAVAIYEKSRELGVYSSITMDDNVMNWRKNNK